MTRSGMTLAIGIALGLSLATSASARDFTVTAWGGGVQDAKREIFFAPFREEEGIKVLDDVYAGGWAPFKAMQDTGVIPWDVIQVETAEMVRGCEEGVFAPIDWSMIGDKEDFIPAAVSVCGVGTTVWSMIVAYNADNIKDAPTSIRDFWNIEKWPGKRGLRQGPKVNLEFALMADGVAPADVYDVLGTSEGVERAFAKLEEIKPHIQWWKSGAQAPEWLVSGDVTFAMAYNGRVAAAKLEGQNLGIVWENTQYDADAWVIPAKSPYVELAHRFIKFASDPKRQAEFSNRFAYGPTTVGSAAGIKPEQMALLPAGDNIATGLYIGSEAAREFWADHLQDLSDRWNAWVAD